MPLPFRAGGPEVIRYLAHAEEAMRRRGLLPAWIEAAIGTPDWTTPDPGHPDRMRSFKMLEVAGGRVLRVVHWTDGADVVVLTAMLDRDALKQRSRP